MPNGVTVESDAGVESSGKNPFAERQAFLVDVMLGLFVLLYFAKVSPRVAFLVLLVVMLLRWRRVLLAVRRLLRSLADVDASRADRAGHGDDEARPFARSAGRAQHSEPFIIEAVRARPKVARVLESCLSVTDLDAAEEFYEDVIGLQKYAREDGRHVFFRCGDSMVLIFNPEKTSRVPTTVAGAAVPMHGTVGVGHLAFAVNEHDIPAWRSHLHNSGVAIESEVHWPQGGTSLYIRDPAGNSIELASPRIWGFPS